MQCVCGPSEALFRSLLKESAQPGLQVPRYRSYGVERRRLQVQVVVALALLQGAEAKAAVKKAGPSNSKPRGSSAKRGETSSS